MDGDELANARAEVITRAINVEGLLDAIISQQYLGKVSKGFLFEVLYDEYFSFGLKVKIFSKITSDQGWFHKLNRLGTIRNYFAHRGKWTVDFGKGPDPFVPDPKKPSEAIDFHKLLSEFEKLADELETVLFEHYRRAGGQLMDNADGRTMIHAVDQ
jgi:hypothetical protein